jgi:glycerophosphoryl diester phosphodiesterase
MLYGDERPVARWKALHPSGFAFSTSGLKRCTIDYAKFGWSTFVPESCQNSVIGVPINIRHLIWGWPNRFLQRMEAADTTVIILGNVGNDSDANGVDDPRDLEGIPRGFTGLIWTDDIASIAPAWRTR